MQRKNERILRVEESESDRVRYAPESGVCAAFMVTRLFELKIIYATETEN